MDAVAEQLKAINGFETIYSNSRYLQAEIRKGLNLIDSDMGTGKSTVAKNFIQKNPHFKTLVISHRVALAKSLKAGLQGDNVSVEFYQDLIIKDPVPGTDANMALRNAHVLVCSVDSLWRLAGSNWDVVFVDEFEQNLTQYYAKTIQYGEHCLNYLQFVLTNSETQILADAHMGELAFDFCHHIGMHSGVYFKNSYQVAQGKKMFVYESKDHLLEEVMQQVMAKGKRYIYANSKEQVKAIGTAIEQERERKHYDGSVLVVHADVTGTDEVKTALENINAIVPKLDILIASPTLGTGFDIKSDTHQFEKTIGFLSSRVGTAEEGHQGLNRARDVQEFHVYLDNAERSEPTDPIYIQNKLVEEVSAETMKVLSIDPTTGDFTTRNALYEWLFCKVKAKQNESSNRYRSRFLELAKKGGYEIIQVAKQKLAAEFGSTVRKEAKDRNNRIDLRDIQDAPVHIGEAFQTAMRNGEDYTVTEIVKSKVNFDLHLDAANEEQLECLLPFAQEVYENFGHDGANAKINDVDSALQIPENKRDAVLTALTYKQNKHRFVDSIKKLSWVNVDAHSAQAFDMKDVQHAESRVSWRHLSIKRAHLIKLLQIAGIDEQLNYNGKQWTADALKPALYEWLRKQSTKDRLFKYSGISVSANILANPVQWFNSHLRSFGVPIESRKKRIGSGKIVNSYFVHLPEWEAVKALVSLRSQGIEESLQDAETLDIETIQRQVASFINELSTSKFKQGYKVRFDKLDEQCRLTGLVDLRDDLAAAFAPFTQEIKDLVAPKYDPPSPLFINNKIAQGGSSIQAKDNSNNGPLAYIEGEEKRLSFEFPEKTTNVLSRNHRDVVYEVANIAVNEYQLDATKVVQVMLEYGLENIKNSALAWAGSVKQAIMEGI
ncbi:plasmid replication protein, CyRepA1 family [Vibrio sp. AND4]|uniref:plasmid replication protein, CyRepA1 family n=1 Tax=Vibrio sp. AND4 TaxID=314289 RepID=UPI00015F3504|nr:plasmid replication protein, CyRepA1 family [Vibrio sp. AND4]EDP57127.1 hypothetical protein AND4_04228 [Vibrio sp. AND4]